MSAAISIRGFALLAVDGSVLFEEIFDQLSRALISWDRVIVVLVCYDVHDGQEDCPTALNVRDLLLCNNAKVATFIPSQYEEVAPSDVASIMSADVEPLLPIDVLVGNENACEAASPNKSDANIYQIKDVGYPIKMYSSKQICSKGTHRCHLSEATLVDARISFIFPSGMD